MKAPWVSVCSKSQISFQHKPPRLVRWGFHPSPFGRLLIGVTPDQAVCLIAFCGALSDNEVLTYWQRKWSKADFINDRDATLRVIKGIFRAPCSFHLILTGTEFQTKVWQAMTKIPLGQTISYAALARRIRRSRAVRAVGTACGSNPIPILVPCHRVISSDGTLGGFGGGLPLKKKILRLEGVA